MCSKYAEHQRLNHIEGRWGGGGCAHQNIGRCYKVSLGAVQRTSNGPEQSNDLVDTAVGIRLIDPIVCLAMLEQRFEGRERPAPGA
jgi:hypothetical protein